MIDATVYRYSHWADHSSLFMSQEKFRYNALHVCAMNNQAAVAEVVLEQIKSDQLFELLYPGDSLESRRERTKVLVDYYLNMPENRVRFS